MLRDPWAEDVAVLSSENVAFGIETAGLGSRCAASIIDILLQALVIGLGGIVAIGITSLFPLEEWSRVAQNIGAAISIALGFVVIWGYYFLFEWLWDGQTPGKRMLGLRVLQINGMPLTPWSALVRNIVRVADFLPAMYGAGALLALMNSNQRRAGDLVAGTIVARERHDASRRVLDIAQAADAFLAAQSQIPATQLITTSTTPPAGESGVLDANAETGGNLEAMISRARLNAGDWEMLADFLGRRDTLKPEVRARLAARICDHLAPKLGQIAPLPAERENWIATLYAQQSQA